MSFAQNDRTTFALRRQCVGGSWEGGEAACPCLAQPAGNQLTCRDPPKTARRYGTSWSGGAVCSKMCESGGQQVAAGQTVCR